IISCSPKRRLAQPGMPEDDKLPGIDSLVGLQIVRDTFQSPGPGADGAPLIGLDLQLPGQPRANARLPARRIVGLEVLVPRAHYTIATRKNGLQRPLDRLFHRSITIEAIADEYRHRPLRMLRQTD